MCVCVYIYMYTHTHRPELGLTQEHRCRGSRHEAGPAYPQRLELPSSLPILT